MVSPLSKSLKASSICRASSVVNDVVVIARRRRIAVAIKLPYPSNLIPSIRSSHRTRPWPTSTSGSRLHLRRKFCPSRYEYLEKNLEKKPEATENGSGGGDRSSKRERRRRSRERHSRSRRRRRSRSTSPYKRRSRPRREERRRRHTPSPK